MEIKEKERAIAVKNVCALIVIDLVSQAKHYSVDHSLLPI